CIERGGLSRQAYFTLTHWVLLWRNNLMWPDQANPRPRSTEQRETWRHRQQVWANVHRVLLLIPALIGLGFAFVPRRRPGEALVAINLWALLILAGIWFGGIRFRVPYDPIITLMAGFCYAAAWERARAGGPMRPAAKLEAKKASSVWPASCSRRGRSCVGSTPWRSPSCPASSAAVIGCRASPAAPPSSSSPR